MNVVQVKLQLIEYLSLTVKSLASSARPTPPTRQMLAAIERCSDTIAHIAQYDRDNLEHAFQVEHLSTMAGFLKETLKLFSTELSTGGYHVPSQADMDALTDLIEQC